MVSVKAGDRVALDQGDRPNGCLTESDIETENPVSHLSHLSSMRHISKVVSNICAIVKCLILALRHALALFAKLVSQ